MANPTRWLSATAAGVIGAAAHAQPLPPVPVPKENPITEAKRVLGKILFWDAQLSSDSSIACGTCHLPDAGGVDPRLGRNPGPDAEYETDDDILGSLGIIDAEADGTFAPNDVFGLATQVTGRHSVSNIMAAYAPDLFWDGRATSRFVDPVGGATVIETGGALESQAVGPIVSSVEMAHRDRDWADVTARLAGVRPLALTTDVPADMAAALQARPTYPDLFADAFGTPELTAARIAMAVATYQRTLVPNEAPLDRWIDGDDDAMTDEQLEGFLFFRASSCVECHREPLFTEHSFRNIGLRPPAEDPGRALVTDDPDDRGKFKVPSLRNVGLRSRFMHNGQLTSMQQVFDFYAHRPGFEGFPENRDPLLDAPLSFSPPTEANIIDFLVNGLTDPRVAGASFPFDRPTLHTELAENPAIVAPGTPGTGGAVPVMLAPGPPNLGNDTFRFGIDAGLGGAEAIVTIHRTIDDAANGVNAVATLGPYALAGADAGAGYATAPWPVADDGTLLADDAFAVWHVTDPEGTGGEARSPIVRVSFYRADPTSCALDGDLDCDGVVGIQDLLTLLTRWGACDLCGADLDDDGTVGLSDLITLLARWT